MTWRHDQRCRRLGVIPGATLQICRRNNWHQRRSQYPHVSKREHCYRARSWVWGQRHRVSRRPRMEEEKGSWEGLIQVQYKPPHRQPGSEVPCTWDRRSGLARLPYISADVADRRGKMPILYFVLIDAILKPRVAMLASCQHSHHAELSLTTYSCLQLPRLGWPRRAFALVIGH